MPASASAPISMELKSALDALKKSTSELAPASTIAKLQTQVDSLDVKLATRHIADSQAPSFLEKLQENDQVARLIRDKKGSAVLTIEGKDVANLLQRKTTIVSTDTGWQPTSGVLSIDRIPGIVPEPRQQLWVEDLLPKFPTTQQVVDFVKVQNPLTIASPVPEASTKPEEATTFVSSSERVRTIACTIPASRQVLDDLQELNNFLQTGLAYYTNLATEIQLLSGDGTAENIHGLIPQATAFNTGLLSASAGWQRIDVLARAASQLAAAKEQIPDFVILHPNDLWALRLTKDGFQRYIMGDPSQSCDQTPSIWGMRLVATTSIASGTFLMGSSSPIVSEIRDRMSLVVEISNSHQDFFVKNLLMMRCERRLALLVKRGTAFISGAFSQSPA
jgi:HK97 family phage major capsid protein